MPPEQKPRPPQQLANRGHVYQTRSHKMFLIERLSTIVIRGPWFTFGGALNRKGSTKGKDHLSSSKPKPKKRQHVSELGITEENQPKRSKPSSSKSARSVAMEPKSTSSRRPPAKQKVNKSDDTKPKGTRVFPELSEIRKRQRERKAHSTTVTIQPNPNRIHPFSISKEQTRAIKIYNDLKTTDHPQSLILNQFECSQDISDSGDGYSSYSDSDTESPLATHSRSASSTLLSGPRSNSPDGDSSSYSGSSFESYTDPEINKLSASSHIIPRINNNFDELVEIAKWCTQVEEIKSSTEVDAVDIARAMNTPTIGGRLTIDSDQVAPSSQINIPIGSHDQSYNQNSSTVTWR